MANRRKRKQRAIDKAHNQKMLDELALALASEGVTNVVAKPVQSPIAFSIQSHVDGSDKDIHWPNQLGWLQHRAGYKNNQRTLFTSTDSEYDILTLGTPCVPETLSRIDVSKDGKPCPEARVYPRDPIDQMLEDLKDAESAEALPADDEQ